MVFQENKAYVRQVLESQVDLTAKESEFVPLADLPKNHRYFDYQKMVNASGVPSEQVIEETRRAGAEYRLETEGPNPVPGLLPEAERNGAKTDYAARIAA
jgi:hypothetical protein